MPLVLNGTTGVSGVDGSAGTPALRGTDADSGVYFTGSQVGFSTNGAGTTMTMDSSGNVTFPGTVVMSSPFAMRNKIINGAMEIDQRNGGAEINPAVGSTYYLDRWVAISSATGKFKIGRNAGSVTPPAGFINYLGITSLSSYSVGASEAFGIRQIVEGLNIADLAWGTANAKTITISFWVRSSLTGTFGLGLGNSGFSRAYPATYTISSANTWEYKTVTIPGDTTGTWLTTNDQGLQLTWQIGYGSSLSGTANAWNAGTAFAPTGAVSVVGTNGATFYLTGVQLEVGSVATPFERRLYTTELQLCQRYYEKSNGDNYLGFQGGSTTSQVWSLRQYIPFGVEKRAAPTMAFSSVSTNWSAASLVSQTRGYSVELGTNVATTDPRPKFAWEASIEL